MPWIDLLPDDSRIKSMAVSGHRHILREIVGGESEIHYECRNCGEELTGDDPCPVCGSSDVAEYQLE